MDLRSQIAAVVVTLLDDAADPQLQIRQLAWALPLARNPENVILMIDSMSASLVASAERSALLVDALTSAANYKQRVTHPTIPFPEWSALLLEATSKKPALFGLAIAAALVPNPAAIRLLVLSSQHIAEHSGLQLEQDAAAACLSRAIWALTPQDVSRLPSKLLYPTLRLLYGPTDLMSHMNSNYWKDAGAYSRLIAGLVAHAPISEVQRFFDTVEACSQIASTQGTDVQQKTFLFALCIQLTGVAQRLLFERSVTAAVRVLKVLQPLGSAIDTTGSFEALDFVRAVALDTLSSPTGAADVAATSLLEPLGWSQLADGSVLFALETCEQLLPSLSPSARLKVVEASRPFLTPPPEPESPPIYQAIFEAAHSLKLAELVTGVGSAALEYLDTILRLYPSALSMAQFDAAIRGATDSLQAESLLKREKALRMLFERAKAEIPGLAPPYRDEDGNICPTTRATFIGALIHSLPTLCGPQEFNEWIWRVGNMLPDPWSALAQAERSWLVHELELMVSNLDLSLADIGIRWWFTQFGGKL